ncbi:MAG: hypothetical protein JXC32_20650 [Anaerolineae bacterium]|nr:hypothetical protein [Anaerolineae bacterium]
MTFDAFETPLKEWAQRIRHIAERLDGAMVIDGEWPDYRVPIDELDRAVADLHDLAEEMDPGSGADLEAYCDDA